MSNRSVSPALTGHRRSTSHKQAMADSQTLGHETGLRPTGQDYKDGEQQLDLTQDEGIDPAPFEHKYNFLASLVDPKNFESLESIRGVEELLRGLNTSATKGLSLTGASKSDMADDAVVRGIVVTSPGGGRGSGTGGSASAVCMDDRHRVYGNNAIPALASNSLLSLMWMALKDRFLVRDVPGQSYILSFISFRPDNPIRRRHRIPGFRPLSGLWYPTDFG